MISTSLWLTRSVDKRRFPFLSGQVSPGGAFRIVKNSISCTWRAPKRTLCWMAVQEACWEPLGALIGPLQAPSWGARLAPIGSKTPQDGPRTALGRLLGVPDGPTLAPRRPGTAPGRHKRAPRQPQDTQGSPMTPQNDPRKDQDKRKTIPGRPPFVITDCHVSRNDNFVHCTM